MPSNLTEQIELNLTKFADFSKPEKTEVINKK